MRIIVVVFLAILCKQLNAQLTHGGIPSIDLRNDVEKYNIPSIKLKDFSKEEIREMNSKDSFDLVYGKSIDVNIDLLENSMLIKSKNYNTYLLKIETKEALALNLTFSKFILPKDAKMYIWSNGRYYGAYTNKNMRKDSSFHIATIKGNNVVIMLDVPTTFNKNNLPLESIHLNRVGYFFLDLITANGEEFESGVSLECHNNVNCAEWDEWCNQIRSAVIYVRPVSDTTWGRCSGSIVNNYAEDFTPYLLTAEHCVSDNVIFENTEVHFNYQSPVCPTQDMLSTNRVIGSELLASCEPSDIGFVKLSEKIPEQFNVYFAGYDTRKRADLPSNNIVTIHHPRGDLKKITSGKLKLLFLYHNAWKFALENGVAEPGSSGGPVFEKNTKRIIAVISKGPAFEECDMKNIWLGKLRNCWHDGGIEHFLGLGIASVYLDGADPILACQNNIELDGDFRDSREYRDEKHQIIIQAASDIIMASNSDVTFVTNPNTYSNEFIHTPQPNFLIQAANRIEITSSTNNTTRIREGSIVRLVNATCISTEEQCGFNYFAKNGNEEIIEEDQIPNNNFLHANYKLYPNPTQGKLKFDLATDFEASVSVAMYDLSGREVRKFALNENWQKGKHQKEYDISNLSDGVYLFKFCINENCFNEKVVKAE